MLHILASNLSSFKTEWCKCQFCHIYISDNFDKFVLYPKEKPPKKIEKVVYAKDDFEEIIKNVEILWSIALIRIWQFEIFNLNIYTGIDKWENY